MRPKSRDKFHVIIKNQINTGIDNNHLQKWLKIGYK